LQVGYTGTAAFIAASRAADNLAVFSLFVFATLTSLSELATPSLSLVLGLALRYRLPLHPCRPERQRRRTCFQPTTLGESQANESSRLFILLLGLDSAEVRDVGGKCDQYLTLGQEPTETRDSHHRSS